VALRANAHPHPPAPSPKLGEGEPVRTVGRFVLDFFCEDLLIAIEIDGGIHLDLAVAAADAERQRLLEELYIRFYRWSAAGVERDCERLLADLAVELQFTKAPLLPGWEKGSGE
jgi:very-short-patch-repair endonuclease